MLKKSDIQIAFLYYLWICFSRQQLCLWFNQVVIAVLWVQVWSLNRSLDILNLWIAAIPSLKEAKE